MAFSLLRVAFGQVSNLAPIASSAISKDRSYEVTPQWLFTVQNLNSGTSMVAKYVSFTIGVCVEKNDLITGAGAKIRFENRVCIEVCLFGQLD
ncbi:unnamed protein product [Clavelina lepadiformis]|uniref:Uncharacterized protein n=1 Tax=Clavelina lepadiformis TaxID=159417 RepID=A0ABP0FHC3_CLALP